MSTQDMKKELRAALYGYRKMSGSVAQRLKALGFVIVRTGKHIILRTELNGKTFQFPLSSSSSDKRGCRNMVSRIYRTLLPELEK